MAFAPLSDRTSVIQSAMDASVRPGGNYRGGLSVLRKENGVSTNPDVSVQDARERGVPENVPYYTRLLAKAGSEGIEDYHSGVPKSACPYPRGSELRRAWLKAWRQCEKEGENIKPHRKGAKQSRAEQSLVRSAMSAFGPN